MGWQAHWQILPFAIKYGALAKKIVAIGILHRAWATLPTAI